MKRLLSAILIIALGAGFCIGVMHTDWFRRNYAYYGAGGSGGIESYDRIFKEGEEHEAAAQMVSFGAPDCCTCCAVLLFSAVSYR